MLDQIIINYEDGDIVVIEKPAGLVVHNPPEHNEESVIDFVSEHVPDIQNLSWPDPTRPGIVHRLDKNTSGLMIIAKTPENLKNLQNQFRARTVHKEYTTLVYGHLKPEQGSIVAEIARHASKSKQTVIPEDADDELIDKLATGTIRPAQTDYKTLKNYQYSKQPLTLVLAKPKTGRMHQIRIHLKHLGFPIIGDPMYFFKPSRRLSKELGLNRQFLHATKLNISHPKTNQNMIFQSELSRDLKIILAKLANQ